ncbi:unnamed protein product [Rhodiola kirilowii]
MDGKSVEQSTLVDRISDLPNNVIDIILSHVPLCDAVRTSVLSKNWRLHWTRVEILKLDYDFCRDILRGCGPEIETAAAMYEGIVGNIILSHQEPIRKFVLHIPCFEEKLSPDIINLWILAVSRLGIHELKLNYEYEWGNEVPSHVFQCVKLKHLSLKGVRLGYPPNIFGQLSSLLSLDLCCAAIYGDVISNIFLNCPLLERFSLDSYDYESFAVNASKLKLLHVNYRYYLNFILENTPNLSTILVGSSVNHYGNLYIKFQGIIDFFGAVPNIENINITGDVLEAWAKQDVPQRLPTALEYHQSLSVCNFNMYSEAQIRSIICLIKSSPKLQTLDISMDHPRSPIRDSSYHLQSHLREAENLSSLRTVTIRSLRGGKLEIDFIEFILSQCPMLQKLSLTGRSLRRAYGHESKMMAKIMGFRRASTQVELIYSD